MREEDWREKNYAFFCHAACEAFPCHTGVDPEAFNCLFCFCPLYRLENCGGNCARLPNGKKDCAGCAFPHIRENYGAVIEKLE